MLLFVRDDFNETIDIIIENKCNVQGRLVAYRDRSISSFPQLI